MRLEATRQFATKPQKQESQYKDPRVPIHTSVSIEVKEKFTEIAKDKGVSVAKLLGDMINDYIEREKPLKRG